MLRQRSHIWLTLAVIFDAALVAASWMICYIIRFHLGIPYKEAVPPGLGQFVEVLPIVLLCNLIALGIVGLYRPGGTRSRLSGQLQLTKAALLAWLGLLAVLYYYRSSPYSRIMLFIFFFVNPLALTVARWLLGRTLQWLYRRGWGLRHAAIIGVGKLAQQTLRKLQNNPWLGIKVEYFIDEHEERQRQQVLGVPVFGSFSNLIESINNHPVDDVFVAVPGRERDQLDKVLDVLTRLPVTVSVVPDLSGAVTLNSSVGELDGLPVIQLRDTPIQGWNALAKRAMDIVGSLFLLLVLGPLMLVLAFLVKVTSSGPVLFRQERMGLGGRPLTMLKFRSMQLGAETETGPVWARRDDPRRTRVGAFMRRTSLDELPQLLNVLRGDMSLVGPRPERPHFVQHFVENVPAYMLRHKVKAGITGWAQVNGLRGNTSLGERLQYDLYYINNWSMGFDLWILLLTPFAAFTHKHAY